MSKRIIDPKTTPTKDLHQYLLGSVAPRPIAFVSTVDKDGNDNIAPYSFFNAFSSNPPILVFSSNRRVRDNSTKDTLQNIIDTKEAVINMVNYNIVRQMAITSVEFPTGTSEFEKSNLIPVNSDLVKPKGVQESPVNMEVKVNDIITLGEHGGAGHLIICEVLRMHIDENVLDGDRINPHKIDLMGRMGRSYYVRASGDAVKTIYQSVTDIPLGYDILPDAVKSSTELTANDLATLAAQTVMPDADALSENDISQIAAEDYISVIKSWIEAGEVMKALALALKM
jgi:flavin reductase (DIM6/NTAB) family NADH-FMN oxidoreductase RutF